MGFQPLTRHCVMFCLRFVSICNCSINFFKCTYRKHTIEVPLFVHTVHVLKTVNLKTRQKKSTFLDLVSQCKYDGLLASCKNNKKKQLIMIIIIDPHHIHQLPNMQNLKKNEIKRSSSFQLTFRYKSESVCYIYANTLPAI